MTKQNETPDPQKRDSNPENYFGTDKLVNSGSQRDPRLETAAEETKINKDEEIIDSRKGMKNAAGNKENAGETIGSDSPSSNDLHLNRRMTPDWARTDPEDDGNLSDNQA